MTKGDKILIVLIIVLSLAGVYFVRSDAFNRGERYVSIQVNGQEIKQITFGPNMIGKTFEIETEYGYNLIEIGDNRARVIDADCPDKLDVRQGWISSTHEAIVCLPNRLVVEIRSKVVDQDEDQDYDYISH